MTRHVSWPSYKEPLDLTVTDLTIDGEIGMTLVDEDDARVRLCDHDGVWTTATLSLRLSPDEDEKTPVGLEGVILQAHAVLRSEAGLARIPVSLSPVTDSRVFEGHLSFGCHEVGGVASLAAELVAVGDPPAYRVVGESHPWTVAIHRATAPPRIGGAPLPSDWIDFATPTTGLEFLKDYASAPVFVDMRCDPPFVWFNQGLGRMKAILSNENAQLDRRRARDLIASQIATSVLTTLLHSGFEEVQYDMAADGSLLQPTKTAVQNVFTAASHLLGVEAPELYSAIADAKRDGTGTDEIWARLQLAAALMAGADTDIERVTREVFIDG